MHTDTIYQWLDGVVPGGFSNRVNGSFAIATGSTPTGQALACTLDFHQVDTGLVNAADGETSIRCELLTLTEGGPTAIAEAVRIVSAAANILQRSQGAFEAQPGTLLAGLAAEAELDFAATPLRHGLLISPTLWGGPVPQYTEAEAKRQTLVLQVVLLTAAEYETALQTRQVG
ncbi:hypothetical protein [Corynebacterium caspium]|uniref:hypothetical protein n=1 Tax=Corynebacterium caspium TaxID=234828 RepID=UPI00037B4543|nr:hypothetical protein [Corynebacterium caspium]WKD58536.1 hypothetical protein CCASP_00535 [Corynebacterium caspium DSM 44850]